MTKEEVKEIAYIAWKGAANAHRMYPDNKHTFTEYWNGAESQFNKFYKADVSGQACSHPDKYFVSGVFGGYWCPKCDRNVDVDCG